MTKLQLVAHPVDLLHVGEDHLGVDPALLHHPGHVLGGEEVRYSGKLLSCGEGQVEVSPSVCSCVSLQGFKVKRLREEVVNESAERQTVGPGLCEVLGMMRFEREIVHSERKSGAYPDSDLLVLPSPALAPDQNGFHLRGETLLPGDAELQGETSVGGHASTLAVSDDEIFLTILSSV